MLGKKFRLTKRGSFAYVYRNGQSVSTPLLKMQYVRSASLRIGFSVSNKIGKAVIRNRIKRQMRAATRACIKDLQSGYQIVFVAKQAIVSAKYDNILSDTRALIQKAAPKHWSSSDKD